MQLYAKDGRSDRCNPGEYLVPIVEDAGWVSGSVWPTRIILPPPGFDSRTVQPVASRYTDCATSASRVSNYV